MKRILNFLAEIKRFMLQMTKKQRVDYSSSEEQFIGYEAFTPDYQKIYKQYD
jgi:hypothetical protein